MGPRLAVPLIARGRLTERLDARRALTVLRAPRGYGRTTLAGQWLRDRPIGAWLDTPAGGGAAAFWPALAQSLERAGVPVGELDRRPPEVAVERALRAEGPPVYLVVDDLDHADDRTIDDELVELLRRAPRLHLLTCVHERGRMRAGRLGDLDTTTLTAADLLFTVEETAELAAAIAPELPRSAAEVVHRECGGWPALTRAVLIELAGRGSAAGDEHQLTQLVIGTVDGIARDVLQERLRHEPNAGELVEFAVSTALAEELTESFAVAVTDDPAAKAHLRAWVDAGVLLVAGRAGSPVYRWPPAARRLFAAELDHAPPGRAAGVHARLAEAYLDDHPEWALGHAVRARAWPLVVRVIDTSWRALIVGHRKRLYEAITATPPATLRRSRRARAMRDVMLQVPTEGMLSRDDLPPDPDAVEALARSDRAPEELDAALAVLVAFRNCAPADEARAVALRVHRFARATRAWHPAAVADLYPGVVSQVGAALLAAGDRTAAADAYTEAFRRADEGAFDYLARDAASKLALIHALSGDLRRSSAWLQRYDAAPAASTWMTTYFEPAATTAALLSAVDRLDIRRAVELSDRLAPSTFPDPFRGLYLYGRAVLALHDGRATDLLEELDEAAADRAPRRPHHAALLAAARADLLLALGRGNQARAVVEGDQRDHPALRTGRARLALLTGDHGAALRHAQDPQWERRAGMRHRQEMLLVRAVAAHRAGQQDVAVHALQQAADAARATGALRPFATVPRAELRDVAAGLPGVLDLLAAEPLAGQPDLFPARVPVVTLTQREQLVLEKLASGLTLQQTADALVVSYNTIRSQQASVYHKLGVDSRADAIARARQWSLL